MKKLIITCSLVLSSNLIFHEISANTSRAGLYGTIASYMTLFGLNKVLDYKDVKSEKLATMLNSWEYFNSLTLFYFAIKCAGIELNKLEKPKPDRMLEIEKSLQEIESKFNKKMDTQITSSLDTMQSYKTTLEDQLKRSVEELSSKFMDLKQFTTTTDLTLKRNIEDIHRIGSEANATKADLDKCQINLEEELRNSFKELNSKIMDLQSVKEQINSLNDKLAAFETQRS